MNSLVGFMLEQTIKNTAPMFLAVLIFSYIAGPFLINLGVSNKLRVVIYSIVSVLAGLWAYSSFDIPERSFELAEALILGIAMFIYGVFIIGLVVAFRNRKSKT